MLIVNANVHDRLINSQAGIFRQIEFSQSSVFKVYITFLDLKAKGN